MQTTSMPLIFLIGISFLLLPTAQAESTKSKASPKFTFDELWNLETGFWDAFLYPQNKKQIEGNSSTVFAPEVQGRVDITRTFDGDELNREYIFGLFSDPNHVSLVGVPINYSITQFTANENIASATTIVTFNATTFGVLVPVTIDTWIEFDSQGKITQYDATFRWFEYLLDYLLESTAAKINATSSDEAVGYISDILAKTICATHEESCTGENKQYDNSSDCYDYLTQKIRFGKSYELGRNTLLCREVHEHMVPLRPDVHCSRIGPSGGNYCVDDMDYEQTVLQKYFNGSWIPFGYGDDQNVWLGSS